MYVTKIRTEAGDLQIDYLALANLPVSDKTLTQADKFADAQATGNMIQQLEDSVENDISDLRQEITDLNGEIDDAHDELQADINSRAKVFVYKTILEADGWSEVSPFTQTVSNGVRGILETDTPIVDLNMALTSSPIEIIKQWPAVTRIVCEDGSITAYCHEKKPTVNFPIIIQVVR